VEFLRFTAARSCAIAFAATLLCVAASAKVTDPSEYKLKFMIVEMKGTGTLVVGNYYYRGTGYANIQDGESIEGIYFEFEECPFALLSEPTHPDQKVRPARWIKEREKLIVISSPTKGAAECKLKVLKMDGHIYAGSFGGASVIAYTQQQYAQLMRKAVTTPVNEALPLTVSILEAKWLKSPFGMVGTGRGNIHDRDSATAFTFTSSCEGRLALTTEKTADRGKWQVEEEKLLVLGQGDGEAGQRICVLQTKLQPEFVYLKDYNTGEISTLTQEEFQELREKKRTGQQAQQPATPQ